MKKHADNPTTNVISAGITETDVLTAVRKSGYPLQMVISTYLKKSLGHQIKIEEEWSFTDDITKEPRTIDIHASKYLYEFKNDHPRIRPTLDLLIECKQSELPYIFFLSSQSDTVWLPHFPNFAGLFEEAAINKEGVIAPIAAALDLHTAPFLIKPPAWCLTFSKCVRQGKAISLSGSDSYLGLSLPLLKAVRHFKEIEKPPETARYFDCHLILCIGVLDAPMIGIQVGENTNDAIYLPWIRVIRHESEMQKYWANITAIDIVHRDFFNTYITAHVLPFATVFANKTKEHQKKLIKADK
jgi:hypothetical protein